MPQTITKVIYKFNELNEDAKKKAINSFYDINVDYDWWDFIYDEAKELGFKINGFDIYGAGYVNIDLIQDVTEICNNIIESHGDSCSTYKLASEYLKRITVIKVKEKLTDEPEEFEEEYEKLEDDFKKSLDKCYLEMLRDDYNYRTSDKAIIETIEANEYDFEEDGSIYQDAWG